MAASLRYQPFQEPPSATFVESAFTNPKSEIIQPQPSALAKYALVQTAEPLMKGEIKRANSDGSGNTFATISNPTLEDLSTAGHLSDAGSERYVKPVTVVRIPTPPPPQSRFELLQHWEGRVTAVEEECFTAVLRDLTDPGKPEEEMIIPQEEVADEDLALLAEGSIFYWMIGYRRATNGQKMRASEIRFRRLPVWTRSEMIRLERSANRLAEVFGIGGE